jgi:hypothetical protein
MLDGLSIHYATQGLLFTTAWLHRSRPTAATPQARELRSLAARVREAVEQHARF